MLYSRNIQIIYISFCTWRPVTISVFTAVTSDCKKVTERRRIVGWSRDETSKKRISVSRSSIGASGHYFSISAFHCIGVLAYSVSTLKPPQSDIWYIKLSFWGDRVYFILLHVEVAAVIHSFTASLLDNMPLLYA